jgi:hypothetical protein
MEKPGHPPVSLKCAGARRAQNAVKLAPQNVSAGREDKAVDLSA